MPFRGARIARGTLTSVAPLFAAALAVCLGAACRRSVDATAAAVAKTTAGPPARAADAGGWDSECGGDAREPCTLETFMARRLDAAVKAQRWRDVAAAFQLLAMQPPRSYADWPRWAREGQAAAAAANPEAVRKACYGCHDQYQDQYRSELQARTADGAATRGR